MSSTPMALKTRRVEKWMHVKSIEILPLVWCGSSEKSKNVSSGIILIVRSWFQMTRSTTINPRVDLQCNVNQHLLTYPHSFSSYHHVGFFKSRISSFKKSVRVIGDGFRNFEAWSNDKDCTCAGYPLPFKLPHHANRRTLVSTGLTCISFSTWQVFWVELMTRWPQVRDHNHQVTESRTNHIERIR
ncbi:hypothetical protein TNCV_4046831 [Trichonephila clavipes]|nr:hypothetical protein TNCV_4046831 [Trichonephila clavipes]